MKKLLLGLSLIYLVSVPLYVSAEEEVTIESLQKENEDLKQQIIELENKLTKLLNNDNKVKDSDSYSFGDFVDMGNGVLVAVTGVELGGRVIDDDIVTDNVITLTLTIDNGSSEKLKFTPRDYSLYDSDRNQAQVDGFSFDILEIDAGMKADLTTIYGSKESFPYTIVINDNNIVIEESNLN